MRKAKENWINQKCIFRIFVLNCTHITQKEIQQYSNEPSDQDNFHILESEVESAIRALKIGKSPGVNNIPSQLLKSGGNILITIFTDIYVTKYGKQEYGHHTGRHH